MKKRGQIWWVNFDPSVGEEIGKLRPAVIVSINRSNRKLKRYQVVPLTRNTDKSSVRPGEVIISVNGEEQVAKSTQIATVSDIRMTSKMGIIAPHHLASIEEAIVFQLGLFKTIQSGSTEDEES